MPSQKQNNEGKLHINNSWVVASGGFLTQVILLIGSSTLPLILVAVEEALGISNSDAGLVISMYGVLYIIGAPFWGLIADRFGLRNSLTLSSVLTSFGILSMSAVNSLVTCAAVYGLIGFGSAALITLIPKLIGAWFDARKRGRASSYITSGGAASASIAGIIVPILAITYSWRTPFFILGLICLLISIVIYAIVKDSPNEEGLAPHWKTPKAMKTTEANKEESAKAKDVLKMAATWHIAALYMIFFMGVLSISIFLVAYLTESGLPAAEAGVGYSVLMIATLVGQYLWGILSDYVPRKYILTACASLLAVFTYIFLTFQMDQVATYALIGLMGISSACTPVIFAVISDYFNPKVIGAATGVIIFAVGIGFILAPLVAGYLATSTGTLATVFQLSILLTGLSAIIALALKRPPKHAA